MEFDIQNEHGWRPDLCPKPAKHLPHQGFRLCLGINTVWTKFNCIQLAAPPFRTTTGLSLSVFLCASLSVSLPLCVCLSVTRYLCLCVCGCVSACVFACVLLVLWTLYRVGVCLCVFCGPVCACSYIYACACACVGTCA